MSNYSTYLLRMKHEEKDFLKIKAKKDKTSINKLIKKLLFGNK